MVKEGCRVDERAEWRSFEDDKGSKERAGPALNPLLDDGGLGSSVSVQLQPGLLHLARVQASLKVGSFSLPLYSPAAMADRKLTPPPSPPPPPPNAGPEQAPEAGLPGCG